MIGGGKRWRRGETALDPKHTRHLSKLWHVFQPVVDDMTADRNSRINSEVYRAILAAHI